MYLYVYLSIYIYLNTHLLNLLCILLNVLFQHSKERRKKSKGILVIPVVWFLWVRMRSIYPFQSYLPWKAAVNIISKQGNVIFQTSAGTARISID